MLCAGLGGAVTPRRILMTADTIGGVWQYALELARGLTAQDVEVTLATFGARPDADQRRTAHEVPGLTLHESEYRLEWMRDPWDDLDQARDWLLDLAATTRPDVVHLNHYCHAALDWPAPVMVVAHSCVYSWFCAVHGAPPGREWERYRRTVAGGLAAADLVVAPTAAMLAAAQRHYGPLPATRVIPNGRRAADFEPGVKQPHILATGRLWDEGKNPATLARVAPYLDWPVRLAGATQGPDGQRGEFTQVELCGPLGRERLAREYADAAIYAAPARYEPFGLGILEAALAGCALVLGDIPSLREVWGPAALYVPPDDDTRLVSTLNGLIRGNRGEIAARARRRALRYGAARMTAAYLDAYRRLTSSRSRNRPLSPLVERVRVGGKNRRDDNPMRVVMFYHSLVSDWNHGNAHFLRGVAGELLRRGHELHVYEPVDGWSLSHLRHEHGQAAIDAFHAHYPRLTSRFYDPEQFDPDRLLDRADLVLVHEWNPPTLIERIGAHRARHRYVLLFHDTHHRSVSDVEGIARYRLEHYDGVLAFGEAVRERYLAAGWSRRVWTWHEAADVEIFRPRPAQRHRGDLVWIGNWGDDERDRELEEFLVRPAAALGLRATVYGVRYPPPALRKLSAAGFDYRGWLPNFEVPKVFARHRVTVHVPRRYYADRLPGIPTIRVFEALACGIPLVCAPWDDIEGLFSPGEDYLVAADGAAIYRHLRDVLADPALAAALAHHGRQTILDRHTCAHRVNELLMLYSELSGLSAQA